MLLHGLGGERGQARESRGRGDDQTTNGTIPGRADTKKKTITILLQKEKGGLENLKILDQKENAVKDGIVESLKRKGPNERKTGQ